MITLLKKKPCILTIYLLFCLVLTPVYSSDIAEEEDDNEWDVMQPQGDMQTITIDTTESTWSNLSVSEDGQAMVFDMLGDIYTMSIVGGEATPLVQGFDWNMQPTYSPDGKTIAYISDRDGASNLWVMDVNGGNPRQISKEKTALIHTPTWSPDGDYIAVTKGFMSSRSIPAGEIWMYHRSGGDGVMVTERAYGPHTQKNMTDPAFSPDGQYLYYTDDMTSGRIWEYGKNSTTELFNIMRHDLETGESSSYIGGAGGAIVPTPSPDGKYMAYLKREDTKTVLYIKDLKSGVDRRLSTEMERDHQETFGSEGNFAYFDWTPDSQHIVYWTAGKFHRLNIDSLDVSLIPMHIKIEKQVQQSPRYLVDVAPDTFDVKMIRWASMSPTNGSVVYQALGKLYLRDVKSGRVKRLTRQNDHDEFYPSFSRDGKSIVYTTWSDKDLGSVRVVSASGGIGSTVTTEPGIYVEPKFSPKGNNIVFRRLTGGYLLSPEWSLEPGIYLADRKAKTMEKVTEDGFNAHFAADEDRLYFTSYAPESKYTELELYSVDLKGRDERTLLKGDKVTEYQLSPDGKWIGYTHQNNAFVAPFLSTGLQQELDIEDSGLPVAQVSKRAGEYLSWSAGSDRLSWSHGATVFSRELNQAFSFLAGAPDELPEPVSEGLNLGFSQIADSLVRPSHWWADKWLRCVMLIMLKK